MPELIECCGAPRDQGMVQGLAFRGAVRDRVARAGIPRARRRRPSLLPFASGPAQGRGPGREWIRHYTHQAERMEGLALGAGIRLDALVGLALDPPQLLREPAPVTVGPGAAWLGQDWPASRETFLVRRSRPEVGFPAVELALSWLAPALAGVNRAGLAALLLPGPAPAVGALLVQECLQRFGDLPSALDWCRQRPGRGACGLLLAAEGRVVRVEIEGEARRVEAEGAGRTEAGPPPEGAVPGAASDPDGADRSPASEDPGEPRARTWIDVRARTLRFAAPGGSLEPVGLEAVGLEAGEVA